MDGGEKKTPHRKPTAGPRYRRLVEKKIKKAINRPTKQQKINNPKAFVAQTSVAAKRHYLFSQTRVQETLHVPIMDRTAEIAPPITIVVSGPPKVGKTTLIRDLIKSYTGQTLKEVNGPITLITGKGHRMTLVECPNDIEGMLDCAKIADVAVMLIDGSFGYEMQTFEFINMMQAQGFPKLIGCLTHMDEFKKSKGLLKKKKQLKKRFWRETYGGAKLFMMSELYHSHYPNMEVKVIARHLQTLKPRPIVWRTNHSFMVADRVEDLTEPQEIANDATTDRKVALYGYVRGTNMRIGSKVCVPGLGDYRVKDVEIQVDPCPLENESKRLRTQVQTVHAPMSDVAGMSYDKDAVYVTLPSKSDPTRDGENEVQGLIGSVAGITSQLNQDINIVQGRERKAVVFSDDEDGSDDKDDDKEDEMSEEALTKPLSLKNLKPEEKESAAFAEEGLDAEENKKAWGMLRLKKRRDLMKEIYDTTVKMEEDSDDDDDLMKPVGTKVNTDLDLDDTSKAFWDDAVLDKILSEGKTDYFAKYFIAKSVRVIDDMVVDMNGAPAESKDVKMEEEDEDDDGQVEVEADSDDEDLDNAIEVKNGEVQLKEMKKMGKKKLKEGMNNDEKTKDQLKKEARDNIDAVEEELGEYKNPFYDREDTFYKKVQKEMRAQNQANHEAFNELDPELKTQVEGAISGSYIKMTIEDVPASFIQKFNPKKIIIVGGVLKSEEQLTVMQAQVVKHRWFPKLVKTRNPIVISVGWRRYQTVATFSSEDLNGKQRMLKYTPKGVFCLMTFYGPACPNNSGLIAFETGDASPYFRPCLTGNISNVDKACEISKKLKLVGKPEKILQNTAFIRGMFNTKVEVSKFIGAKIQTVSGIRGQIKKACSKPQGTFRATFEAKLAKNDIVFLKGWIPVKINKFYNPMTDLTGDDWERMRLVRELRQDMNIGVPTTKRSSKYNEVTKPREVENHLQKVERLKREEKMLVKEAGDTLLVHPKTISSLSFAQQLQIMESGKVDLVPIESVKTNMTIFTKKQAPPREKKDTIKGQL
ncbi:ribosome biogenesis protein BMS1, putative [Entamoeba invadens IP1]|uniref:ribosome biogenesis protein BMS1, putative n=1 Tax=Entamoeba invadens IP1 TaxID=370355 RepID=UPI0002C3F539|nr:ribosome biogenesis protein BMS1, putative [Entamoeba invadens IP1]ELP90799.1 ribosome biogenesis protein BMS1, putative [Entamoeba invadens IP1]|eukprot:XP_004257570.1 ribosome biogenesis protein BMS1, putative [Entamoeba invadens IP1]